ncbi:UNVERIFIED_CONTAM: hypothetical protein Sangu_1277700 [Sesamum angustifolium]|uniref:Pyrrolo-quinoline quinone repeat domain-containing protein n=1 Tax=Sesamum angustifolium TaxID=2727405 RepID=A0AAW2NKH8_9LAMI
MQGREKGYQKSTGWLNHGGNIYNRRYAAAETKISPSTAPNLHLKWEFKAGKDISATPAICDGVVYFPSWNGFIYAVKTADGSLVWRKNVQELTSLNPSVPITNVTGTVSRATPTIAEDMLIIPIYGPAYVVALKRKTGQLIWMRQLDRHPAAVITMSGTYFNKAFYVGVSSLEETYNIEDCCTFRGSFAKLDFQTGAILWQTIIPDNNGKKGGYAGAALWGSSPSIDVGRNHVYIATGNLYSAPESVEECQERQNNQTVPTHPDECIGPDIHFDSMLALDLNSGEIKWYRQLGGYDVWFFCLQKSLHTQLPSWPQPRC